jgi:hypothetical protein
VVVEIKARQAELDILAGHFDATLAKYKIQANTAYFTDGFSLVKEIKPRLS